MDDEAFGCGGTIARHVEQGDSVTVCVVANRAYGHIYEPEAMAEEKRAAENARQVLGYERLVFLDLPDERLDSCLQDIIVPLEKA
jgi:LmbE family N-acetylglucosaminyl deacetylase